jgi:23S rRNA pseudouridine2605 synthase
MNVQQGKIRLQAYLASCGLGSRRSCEKLILDARVTVNGKVATIGESAVAGDEVRFDGRIVRPHARLRYIALNKPPGYVTSMSDERGRPIASSLLGSAVEERVYNVGRLDQWSSGLLLYTNDGDLTALMVHPSGLIDKEYQVETDLPIPENFASDFAAGLTVDGISYKAESISIIAERKMRIVLIEGKNREIRRVLEHFSLRALALRRVRIGPIELGDLAEGAYRELGPDEVLALHSYSERSRAKGRGL